MDGAELVDRAKKKFGCKTDAALAEQFGVTILTVQNWKRRSSATPRQVLELLDKATIAARDKLARTAIRPIVEFCRIDKTHSAQGKTYTIIKLQNGNGAKHRYREGLKDELQKYKGVYVFFDSRGQAIYAGKAQKQSLWKEMNLAFNRNRGEVQNIKRVKHPSLGFSYEVKKELNRQIRGYQVPLHDIAHYVSAYEVAEGMIGIIEAMLVRSFANDLLNIRMEKFPATLHGDYANTSRRRRPRGA